MNKKLGLNLYRKMYLIRRSEEKIRELYPSDQIRTPSHLAIGEEAIAVGVIEGSGPKNQIFGTYRNHGIYLAKTEGTDEFFGELFGKKIGLSKGKAGSMHIMAPDKDFMATSAIVGSTVSLAVGCAYANIYLGVQKKCVVFFGDGAIDEGAFWESLNFAAVKKIPVLFVCEDNNYAIHSHSKTRHGYKNIADIVSRFECFVSESATTDVEKIYILTKQIVARQRKNPKPAFLYLKYYRYLEHVGINYDFEHGYRSEREFKRWLKIDPLIMQRKRLIKKYRVSEKEVKKIEDQVDKQIQASVQKTINAPFPEVGELTKDVYYE